MIGPSKESADVAATHPSETTRTVLSLCLFAHLFAVGSSLAAYSPSGLQERLWNVFSPYVQTLGFGVEYFNYFRRFHLTHNSPADDIHSIELSWETADGHMESTVIPNPDLHGDRYRREQLLAYTAATLAENDQRKAIIPEAILEHFLARRDIEEATLAVRSRSLPSTQNFPGRMELDSSGQAAPPAEGRVLLQVKGKMLDGQVSLIEIQDELEVAAPVE